MTALIDRTELRYIIRLMQKDDIEQVTAVDRLAFPTDEPPTSFEKRLQNKAVNYIVACDEKTENTGVIINTSEKDTDREKPNRNIFAGMSLPKPRQLFRSQHFLQKEQEFIYGFAGFWLVIDEAHLLDIGVRPDYHRMGIGESLIISVINMALKANARLVTLEVRVSNYGAQALYRKYGFVEVGKRFSYYPDNHEDALIMNTDRLNTPIYRALFEALKRVYVEKWGDNHILLL
jgi:[ribosomal protein S18]-alanine N-acetyltransferase